MKVGAVVGLVLVASLSACSDRPDPGPRDGAVRQGTALLFSPNGEPLNGGTLGQPSCDLAMHDWFDRTDANHDARLDRDEFLTDARAQFAKVDVERRGFVTSSDLERYRKPFRDGTHAVDVRDPVMAADANLNGLVTEAEFLLQAEEALTVLDTAARGYVAREDLPALCAAWTKAEKPKEGGRPLGQGGEEGARGGGPRRMP